MLQESSNYIKAKSAKLMSPRRVHPPNELGEFIVFHIHLHLRVPPHRPQTSELDQAQEKRELIFSLLLPVYKYREGNFCKSVPTIPEILFLIP